MNRRYSLRKGAEFDRVYREGTVVSGPLFVVRVIAEGSDGSPRWGFAVGKRLSKSAVVRNRLRRRLREAARAAGAQGGYDIVVTARRAALAASFLELVSGLREMLAKAGVELAAVGER